jgi:hypothetical protein
MLFVLIGAVPLVVAVAGVVSFLLLRAGYGLVVGALLPFATALLLGLLWRLGRTVRNTGFMILVFTVWYGFMRVVTDFLRVDKTYFGLTGSQILEVFADQLLARGIERVDHRQQRTVLDPGGGRGNHACRLACLTPQIGHIVFYIGNFRHFAKKPV